MYFKKLELFGFKSFADKTILNFEPGITAVVGPNGCGKSNIFDAIRWALGEQSTKELRGSSMEDVIFNGTAQKPSLGFAEVSMSFANESRALPVDYDEVTITRRLFRSGESEYMLNKTIVRLKDIQELLMGTGIGAEAYSLVQQGKVDLVVSARPEDRRMIFDEAAGITKYKSKRKEAFNKLKETENNLLRINDITIEVRRQISSMERQVERARKYKDEFKKLEELEIRWASHQVRLLGCQRGELNAKLEELRTREQGINQELESQTSLLTDQINYSGDLEQKASDLHAEQIKLEGEINLGNSQIGFNQERIEEIDQSNHKRKEQKAQLIERCRIQQEKIEDLNNALSVIQSTIGSNEDGLKEKRLTLSRLEVSIKEAREKILENEEKILGFTSQQVSIRNELTDVMKEIQGELARKRRLEIECEKITNEQQGLNQKLQNTDAEIIRLDDVIGQLEKGKENQGHRLDALRLQLADLKQRIDALEKKGLFYKSQKDFIEKLHNQYDEIPDPLVDGRLITQTSPLEHHTGIIGKVKQVSPLQPGVQGLLKNIFAKNDAQQWYEIICEAKFIELDPQQISAKIEEITREIQQLNIERDGYIVRIEEEAQTYKNIQQAIHDQEKTISVAQAQRKDLGAELGQLRQETELNVVELQEVEGELAGLRKREEELNYKLDTVTQEIEWCQNDMKDKQAWITGKSQEKEGITVFIAQMEAEIVSHRDKLRDSREHLEMFSKDLDGWLEEIKRIDDELSKEESRRAQLENETRLLMERIDQTQRSQESFKTVLSDCETQRQDLAQRINSFRAQITALESEIDKIRQDIHEYQLKDQEFAFNERAIKDRLQQTYKIDFDGISGAEVLSAQAAQADQSSDAALVIEPPSINQNSKSPKSVDESNGRFGVGMEKLNNEEEFLQNIERLRKRCESFGNVNLVAIEEYEELKQRFEFLTKQQSDLLEAKSQLMSTITKINRSTRQMFVDTFAKVGEEFRVHFRMLFGGGEAQLVLLDPENVLESGIDIIVRPPGKKLQNISLLSGGEKTLTAIALIFGVFKVNPSPFCILDEIDAALDDSNVGRFSYLLKEFSKIAQFIVITHNKKTISSANVMYGITMPESGISRIVSVKFSEDKKKEEENALAAV